ncbi:MAG: polyprenyl synthetase family protein [Paludibacter sp.]|nr:polyprenyl synthetase family protein [Paludibacter sp.]
MSLIDDIKQPISDELHIFKRFFADALRSDNPLLASINEYILHGSGKQLRPILTLLSAKLCGDVNESTYNGALAIELLHNASLIHDDVVDDTSERRGRSSINARWSNKVAILTGDYMLSNSLISATKTHNIDVLYAVSRIGMELSDGELIQLSNTHKTKITEEEYFKIIRKKTASLFATCAEIGGLTVAANPNQLQHLKNFGEYMGICFQIKDDIFDYYKDLEIGKPTENDLQDGKVTLPLIYALQTSEGSDKENVLSIMDSMDFSPENIELVMNFARENGGVEYADKKMDEFKQKAIRQLDIFEESNAKKSLILCAEFAASRDI